MPTTYTVRLAQSDGTHVAEIASFVDTDDGPGLDYVLNVGQIGALTMCVPAGLYDTYLAPQNVDWRLSVWRSINGQPPALDGEGVFLIRQWQYTDYWTRVTALHANHLLSRRVIAYPANSTQASLGAAAAGNQVKTFASQNLGSGIVAASRDGGSSNQVYADISALLSIQGNAGDGASIAKAVDRRSLIQTIWELCQASTQGGTYLAAEVVGTSGATGLELRTYATQRGTDHRASSGAPVILSRERKSLSKGRLTIDRSSEVTFAIAVGAGSNSEQIVRTSYDATRIADSPFNRIEAVTNAGTTGDATALQNEADAAVRAGRPRISFTGELVETDGATRGIHFDYGDMVTAEFRGVQYDVRLDTIRVTLQGGKPTQHVQLRSVA